MTTRFGSHVSRMARLTPIVITLASSLVTGGAARAEVPAGYPADYQSIVDAAKQEGKVVVYGRPMRPGAALSSRPSRPSIQG